MKRDMELVIKILEYFEAREEISVILELDIHGYDRNIVAYHLRRMYEGGLLDAEGICSSSTDSRVINVLPFGLTWQGHEFLDALRSNKIRKQISSKLSGSLSQVPFALIKELAMSLLRQNLGI